MSGAYGKTDDAQSIAVIHAAIERGVTFLDTGDYYGSGHNELLIGKAIAGRRDQVQLSVKFGVLRGPGGSLGGIDARPAAVKNFLAYSLVRLGTDHVDVYRPARLDPAVPIEDTIGAIADLVKAGYVRSIGLSEVGPETIRRAAKVHPIADLQIEYSIASRDPEDAIFPVLAELGIGATLYGVLSRGLLSASPIGAGDGRAHLPRFTGANGEANARLVAGSPGPREALGHHAESARDRLGARQAAAVRTDARHAHDPATRRGARGEAADRRAARRGRGDRAARCDRGHALPGRADDRARQREALVDCSGHY